MLDKAIKATTQQHLDIHTIKDHLVILKDGSAAMVLQTSAINFGLLSEEEQDATIFGYASLINSLSFQIQIILRSTRKDISEYVERLDEQLETIRSQKIKEQIIKYRTFIKGLVKENKVMEKKFFVVIPYGAIELGINKNTFNPLAKAPQKPAYEDSYILEKAKITLYPRRDHLIRQFARLGLLARQLDTQELVNLFYKIYNPNSQVPPLLANPKDFETTVVQTTTPIQPPEPTNVIFQAPGQKVEEAPTTNPSAGVQGGAIPVPQPAPQPTPLQTQPTPTTPPVSQPQTP